MLFGCSFLSKDPCCFLIGSNFLCSDSSRMFICSFSFSRFLSKNCFSLDLLCLNPGRPLTFSLLLGLQGRHLSFDHGLVGFLLISLGLGCLLLRCDFGFFLSLLSLFGLLFGGSLLSSHSLSLISFIYERCSLILEI